MELLLQFICTTRSRQASLIEILAPRILGVDRILALLELEKHSHWLSIPVPRLDKIHDYPLCPKIQDIKGYIFILNYKVF